MKLWLDDIRPMPDGYDIWITTASEAIVRLACFPRIIHVSFDHDLGIEAEESEEIIASTGYDVAKAIEIWAYVGFIPFLTWDIHSANPVGYKNIEVAMTNANRFWSERYFNT